MALHFQSPSASKDLAFKSPRLLPTESVVWLNFTTTILTQIYPCVHWLIAF